MDALELSIGGRTWLLRSPLPFAPDPFPSEYATFRRPAGDGTPDVRVDLHPGIPAAGGWGDLTHTGGPWRLFRDGPRRRVVWDGNDPLTPLWLADILPGEPTVTVHCGARLVSGAAGHETLRNPVCYPLDQILLMYQSVAGGENIVHSAGLIQEGGVVVAAGRSGAGKSTLSRLWRERHGSGSLLSDDRLIVCGPRDGAGIPQAYGSPWPGELGAALNQGLPARALVFLEQAPTNELVPLSFREAVERLLPLCSIPWFDPDVMTPLLAGLERWAGALPAYVFRFTPDDRAVLALETIRAGVMSRG